MGEIGEEKFGELVCARASEKLRAAKWRNNELAKEVMTNQLLRCPRAKLRELINRHKTPELETVLGRFLRFRELNLEMEALSAEAKRHESLGTKALTVLEVKALRRQVKELNAKWDAFEKEIEGKRQSKAPPSTK